MSLTTDEINIAENLYSTARKLYEENNYDASIAKVKKAADVYKYLDMPEMIFECEFLYASNLSGKLEFNKSLELLHKCEEMCNKFDLNNGLMRTYNLVGYNYSYLNNYEKAIQAYENAMKIAKNIYDDKFIVKLCLNLLTIYTFMNSYDKSASIIIECYRIFKGSKFKTHYAIFLEKISLLYSECGEYKKSNDINSTLFEYYTSENNIYKKGIILFYFANNYFKMKDFEKAIEFYSKSKEFIDKSSDNLVSYEYYLHLGLTNLELNNLEIAKLNFDKFLDTENKEIKSQALVFEGLAVYYFRVNDFINSKLFFNEAINLLHSAGLMNLYIKCVIKYLKFFKNKLESNEIYEILNGVFNVCEKSADFEDMISVCEEFIDYFNSNNDIEKSNFYKNKLNYLNLLKMKKDEKFKIERTEIFKKIEELNLTI